MSHSYCRFFRFLNTDSYKPRKDYCYCRFRVHFVSNYSRLSCFVESYRHKSTWKRSKQQYIKNYFLFLLSVQKNHLLKWQYEKQVYDYVLSFYVNSTVAISKSPIRTVAQNLVQQYEWATSRFLLPGQQSPSQKARYILSYKILSNSTKEQRHASYCRGNSRKLKMPDMNCRPRSRSTAQESVYITKSLLSEEGVPVIIGKTYNKIVFLHINTISDFLVEY